MNETKKWHLYIVSYNYDGVGLGSLEIFLKEKWTKGTIETVRDYIKGRIGVGATKISLASIFYAGEVEL